jgi:hypothetical protein
MRGRGDGENRNLKKTQVCRADFSRPFRANKEPVNYFLIYHFTNSPHPRFPASPFPYLSSP